MIDAQGIVRIEEVPEQITRKNGSFFNLTTSAPDLEVPEKNKIHYYRVSIFVPIENLNSAVKTLTKGTTLLIRHLKAAGNRLETGTIMTSFNTSWKWVYPMKLQ